MPLVLPPIAWSTTSALRKDSRDKMVRGVLLAAATATALCPVSSAIRNRAADTAGALAPFKGMSPRAAVRHAMVLAVPITPHVPIYCTLVCVDEL